MPTELARGSVIFKPSANGLNGHTRIIYVYVDSWPFESPLLIDYNYYNDYY
jgi:hypothetical protein